MPFELRIPGAGESITQVQIGAWMKAEGDRVERDEPVVEIETDKAAMDLPAPVAGRLAKVLKRAGDVVAVGEVIAYIDESGGGLESRAATAVAAPAASTPSSPGEMAATGTPAPSPQGTTARPRIMPAAQRVLAERGLGASAVRATGPGGRLLKEDVVRQAVERVAPAPSEPGGPPLPIPPSGREEEVVPMSLLRRKAAERLVQAQQSAALLTTFNELDMSAVLRLRQERGEAFEKKYGVKLGILSFFVKAVIDALKQTPQLNAEVRGADIVYKNYYDIGVAVSTDRGLVVPVLRSADRMSFAEVERAIADLAARARDKKIMPEELTGGTFTISNGGVFGSLLSTPIVNPPQSGILGLHVIQDRPVVRDGQIVIRPMMYVALTYDHRIVDGRESVLFLRRIRDCVEDPARMLIEV